MSVRSDMFMTYCALASARAQLVPAYREQAIEAIAGALASGHDGAARGLRILLDDADLARACARAAWLRQTRDVATFDRVLRAGKAAIVSFSRRIAKIGRRIVPNRRPPRRNR